MAEFRGCLFCLEPCASKHFESVSDQKFKDSSDLFNSNLNIVFVLKSVLGMPQEILEKYLVKHGSPTEWGIFVCAECKQKYLDRATKLQVEESRIKQQFETLRNEVKGHIHTSHVTDQMISDGGVSAPPTKGKGRGKRKVGADKPGPVFNEIRKWVVDNGDPIVKDGIDLAIEMAGGVNSYIEHMKAEKAFKILGAGKKLNDPSQPGPSSALGISVSNKVEISSSSGNQSTSSSNHSNSNHDDLPASNNLINNVVDSSAEMDPATIKIASEQKRAAANAALARFDKEKAKKPNVDSIEMLASRQSAFIKEQARKELEQEKNKEEGSNNNDDGQGSDNHNNHTTDGQSSLEIPVRVIDPANYAVQGVFYTCPEIRLHTPLPKAQVEKQIREYLTNQISDVETPYHIPIQIIYSCNKPVEKVHACVELLWKIVDNIIQNPTDHKYRQIKCSNKSFKEKVTACFGGELFLKTAAFRKDFLQNLDTWNKEEEEYWVFDPEDDVTYGPELIKFRNMLKTTPAIKPILDRNVQVLRPQQITSKNELPDEFYLLSKDEVKREQQSKTEIAERELTLRTKAMRERDEIRERRIYRFGVIRIKFPDSNILQGTFNATDKLSELYKFVRESLISEFEFDLIQPGGKVLNKSSTDVEDIMSATLSELNLLPSTILNFRGGEGKTPETILSGELPYLNTNLMEKLED